MIPSPIMIQLDPGPIPPITSNWLTLGSAPPSFNQDAIDLWSQIDPILLTMDTLLDPFLLVDLAPPYDDMDVDLDAIGSGLGALTGTLAGTQMNGLDIADLVLTQQNVFDPPTDTAPIDVKQTAADQGFLVTGGAMPGEAYEPVPPSLLGSGSGGPPVGVTIPNGTLENLTNPGATDFTAGDRYRVTITLLAGPGGSGVISNVEVTAYTWFNNVPNHGLDLGSTDSTGFLIAEGTFGPGAVGAWGLEFVFAYPDGSSGWLPVIYWQVDPNPNPISPITSTSGQLLYTSGFYPQLIQGNPPPSDNVQVYLTNTTRPGVTNFQIGDDFNLTITGEPLADVLIAAFQNGNVFPWVVLGQMDQNGSFVLTGTFSDPIYIGDWTEFYQVGSVVYGGDLQFSVLPS